MKMLKKQGTYCKLALTSIDYVYKQTSEKYVTDFLSNNANNAICIYTVCCF